MPTKEELKKLQSDPLPQKVLLTKARIREWYYKWGGQVYVSFSGGKDSTALLHLVRQEFHLDGPSFTYLAEEFHDKNKSEHHIRHEPRER